MSAFIWAEKAEVDCESTALFVLVLAKIVGFRLPLSWHLDLVRVLMSVVLFGVICCSLLYAKGSFASPRWPLRFSTRLAFAGLIAKGVFLSYGHH